MKKTLLLASLLISLSSLSQSDQNITGSTPRETEPYIAVNPANPSNLIAAWMSLTFPFKIVTKASFDGGVTWGNVNYLPHFSSSFTITSADVSIAFNSAGTAFISYVDYKITLDSGFVRVARSSNGGVSWDPPVNAIDALSQPDLPVDRPWIVCDQSSSPYSGRLYLLSKSYWGAAPPHKIWLSISSDSGATFSPIVRLDNPIAIGSLTNIMVTPTVGADGTFYGAYMSWDTSQSPFVRMICTRSTDGGSTFTQSTIGFPVSGSAITDTLYQGSYSLSANPADPNNLVFQVTDARNGDPDILALNSNNAGLSWYAVPIRVNDDSLGNGIGQDMSWGAFAPNGVYAVAWRDRRNGLPNDTSDFEIYTAVSLDGGATFKPNFCLSSAQSPYINITRGNDFLGLCLSGNYLFAAWSDLRNGNPNREDIYVRKVSINTLASADDSGISGNGISVFPNPNPGEFTLNLDRSSTVAICDLYGRQLLLTGLDKGNTLLKTDLAGGTYVLRVWNETGIFTRKIIVFK
ncbi:MAG: T9SS type A sorting domain-containing protein [Bacteroidota bacterium]